MQVQLATTHHHRERRARFSDFRRSGDRGLRDRLVRRHLPLARRLASRYGSRGVAFDDLYQVASVALVHAVDRFDPEFGTPFEAFATPTILGELKHHFRDRSWDVHVPRKLQELHVAVDREVGRLSWELGRSPTIPEVARAVGVGMEEVLEAIDAGSAFNARSLSTTGENSSADLADSLALVDPWMDESDDRLFVARLLEALQPRERLIVRMHYWSGMSQSQIAGRLGISQMHVSRLLRRSLAVLRGVGEDH